MSEDNKLSESEDSEFIRTGISRMNLKLNIKVTHEDLVKDLVNRTEGNTIDPDQLPEINNN